MTARERIPNTPLSGRELRALLVADYERLLDNFGELATTAAYGRVSYVIKLAMHLANPHHPYADIEITSRPPADDVLAANPALAALEAPPLADPGPESGVAADELRRDIVSPNAERLRAGLPVPVEVRQPAGGTVTEHILYPPDPAAVDTVTITDVSEAQRVAWHIAEAMEAAAEEAQP